VKRRLEWAVYQAKLKRCPMCRRLRFLGTWFSWAWLSSVQAGKAEHLLCPTCRRRLLADATWVSFNGTPPDRRLGERWVPSAA
jgi:hypothetical protein